MSSLQEQLFSYLGLWTICPVESTFWGQSVGSGLHAHMGDGQALASSIKCKTLSSNPNITKKITDVSIKH